MGDIGREQFVFHLFFFFFQAEDGIRDGRVTGVQTCALPISILAAGPAEDEDSKRLGGHRGWFGSKDSAWEVRGSSECRARGGNEFSAGETHRRSEERRVGKECRSRGSREE